ncbi:MAG: endonuclease III domain-containing protein [Candidatus Woesearchaeota archaeon]
MNELQKLYTFLLKTYGPQGWWPIGGKYSGKKRLSEKDVFEVCVGAILTQNTSWRNVEKALLKLREKNSLEVKKIASMPIEKLALLIRSSGYFRQKAKSLSSFARHVVENYEGNLKAMFKKSTPKLREELLSLWGIGPETADSILLYAGQKPVFVVDAYTKRLLSRLGLCTKEHSYEQIQELFHRWLPTNVELFKEFHALIVRHEKELNKNKHRKIYQPAVLTSSNEKGR